MSKRPTFIELRKFNGSTLADACGYLKRDVSKAFQDAFTIFSGLNKTPTFYEKYKTGLASGTSTTIQTLALLELPIGKWHIIASASYSVGATSHTITDARIWMTHTEGDAALPDNLISGYNYSSLIFGTGDANNVPLSCHWFIDLRQAKTVYLQGRPVYSGGAGTLTAQCALVAHGIVME